MVAQDVRFYVLILDDEVRARILNLLAKHEHLGVGVTSPDELIAPLKRESGSTILIDCESVLTYGVTVISKLKATCPESKLILFCSRTHRRIIKPVMELGAYGCIIEPYREWEFLTMVRPMRSGQKIDKKASQKKG